MISISKGLIHIYTGDGKGKTTAAIGMAVRARGAGLSVLFAQLFKHKSSEIGMLGEIGARYMQYASQHPLFKKYSPEELKKEKDKCLVFLRSAFEIVNRERQNLLVIDEIGPALSYGLVEAGELISLIKSKPEKTELIMTGRGFSEPILALADYITEMKMIKHPFTSGVGARKGIEY